MKVKMISLPDELHMKLQKEGNASGLIVKLLIKYFGEDKPIDSRISELEAKSAELEKEKLILIATENERLEKMQKKERDVAEFLKLKDKKRVIHCPACTKTAMIPALSELPNWMCSGCGKVFDISGRPLEAVQ